MRTWGQFLLLLALCAGAGLLSLTQAWAIAGPTPCRKRYLGAWAISTLGLALPVLLLLGWGSRINPLPGDVAWAVLILAALTAAAALLVAAKLGTAAALRGATAGSRAWRLFPIHVLALGVLGMLDVFVLYAIALGRIH